MDDSFIFDNNLKNVMKNMKENYCTGDESIKCILCLFKY